MRLWTIQPLEVLEIIKQEGEFVCNPNYSDPDFKRAYHWLVKQMDNRGIEHPYGLELPIWAWYKTEWENKKPDLEQEDFSSNRKNLVCIELEIKEGDRKEYTHCEKKNEVDKKYLYHGKKVDAILVDEAQFLSEKDVDALSDIVDFCNIPVLCYGLRTDFQSHLFTGSKRLLEIADVIEEVPTVCWCGKRAQCNVRHSNGKIVREGEQIMLGANESYVALCRKHYKEGKLWDKL